MSDGTEERGAEGRAAELSFEVPLEAPPETVWRAISQREMREAWLPGADLAQDEPVASAPGEAVSYRMRDREPPFLESVVTFRVAPATGGGSVLRIEHGLTDARVAKPAANDNRACLMRAA